MRSVFQNEVTYGVKSLKACLHHHAKMNKIYCMIGFLVDTNFNEIKFVINEIAQNLMMLIVHIKNVAMQYIKYLLEIQ